MSTAATLTARYPEFTDAKRELIEVSDDLDTVRAAWSFDGQQLVFTDVRPENSPFEMLWEAHRGVLTDSE